MSLERAYHLERQKLLYNLRDTYIMMLPILEIYSDVCILLIKSFSTESR